MSTAIKINDISKKYGSRTVLNHVTFETNTGEVFGLLGPNGAGKTTLIKLITGLLYIEEGSIEICGDDLETHFEQAMSRLGAIVENPEMYKYMSGWQNLKQYARMRDGITEERMHEVVELVGLSNRINEKVGKYSLGMRQRLGLALSLLHQPKVLVLDEPTNGLDPAGIKQLRDIITGIAHNEDICVIVSSHLMSEMELMCDRVGIIVNGNIIRVDTMSGLTHSMGDNQVMYEYHVSDSALAEKAIKEKNPDARMECADAMNFAIHFPAEGAKENASGVTKTLVEAGVDIYAMTPKETQKLEDAFIEITSEGGNQIA